MGSVPKVDASHKYSEKLNMLEKGCDANFFADTITSEYYKNLEKIRIFGIEETIDFQPTNIEKQKRFVFRKFEGKILETSIRCKYCDCELACTAERKLFSLPSDEWQVLQWGCPELKTDIQAKRRKKSSVNLFLYSALWIEIQDVEDFEERESDSNEDEFCPECNNYVGKKGVRYFLPSVRVTLVDRGPSDETIFQIDEKLETCLAEKILELGKIRPIFRFSILDQNLTISSTESYFQFGKGKSYKPVLKIRLETDPHPINKSLVEIELEDSPRAGMKIPFPEHLVKDLKFLFAQNRKLLPPSLRSDEKNTFLHYKI